MVSGIPAMSQMICIHAAFFVPPPAVMIRRGAPQLLKQQQMLIGGIAYGFQRSAVDLRPSMRSFQSEEHSGSLCVLQWASLTVDIRQHDQSVAARRHSSRLPRHDCVGVFAALLFGVQLFAVQ